VPLVYGDDGKRLAKRHGSHSLAALRDAGVDAARVIAWCARSLGLTDARALTPREFLACATPEALRAAMQRVRAAPTVYREGDIA
jgi:glutamyl/glutaminyl-tRNA synthetase